MDLVLIDCTFLFAVLFSFCVKSGGGMGVMALLAPWFLRPGTESRERAVRSLLFGGSRIADGTEARRTDRLREKHNERKSFQIKISHFLAFERMVSSKNKQNMSVHL